MKLYYQLGDGSLAARMILHEGGIVLDGDKLDIFGKRTASGADIRTLSPFGVTPALKIADGVILTQPIAILLHCAHIGRGRVHPATALSACAPARKHWASWSEIFIVRWNC